MAYELVYTSAPAGLAPGSSGFCVVACTKGMGVRLTYQLEALSAYKPLYAHYADNAWENPVSHAHCIYEGNGVRQHILSRICFNGVDYTGRSNKLASHLVINQQESARAAGGPASLFLVEGLFKDASWEIKAEHFMQQCSIPATDISGVKCVNWEMVTGDAGWGGYLAQCYLENPGKRVYISYTPAQHDVIIYLIQEAINLLPEDKRWEVTFNTYFVSLPAGVNCSWRCCPADSDAMIAARRSPLNTVIDLANPEPLTAQGELIDIARSGVLPQQPVKTAAGEYVTDDAAVNEANDDEVIQLKGPIVAEEAISLHASQVVAPPVQHAPLSVPQTKNSSRKIFYIIIVATLFLLAAGGGTFLYFKARQEEKIFDTGCRKCNDYNNIICDITARHQELKEQFRVIKSAEDCKRLIKEVTHLLRRCSSLQENLEKLSIYSKVFQRRSPIISPEDLNADCNRLTDELHKDIKYLKKLLKKFSPGTGKKSSGKKAPAGGKKVPGKKAPAGGKNVPGKKAPAGEKKPLPAKVVTGEDPRYIWKKYQLCYIRESKEKKIVIALDISLKAEDIILSLPDSNYSVKAGGVLKCKDGNYDDVEIVSSFVDGKLTISVSGKRLPKEHEILQLIIKGETYPLYFQLGTSRLLPVAKKSLDFKIGLDGKFIVSLPESIIRLPEQIYPSAGSNPLKEKQKPRLFLRINEEDHEISNGKVMIPSKKLAELQARERALENFNKNLLFILGEHIGLLKKHFCSPNGKKNDKYPHHEKITDFIAAYNLLNTNKKVRNFIKDNVDGVSKQPTLLELYIFASKDSYSSTNASVSEWLEECKKFLQEHSEVADLVRKNKNFPLEKIYVASGKKYSTGNEELKKSDKTIDGEFAAIKKRIALIFKKFKGKQFELVLKHGDAVYPQFKFQD